MHGQTSQLFAFAMMQFVVIFAPVRMARAEVPRALEPRYSEAVLAFQAKQFDHAIGILDELLKKSPNLPEFLELEALTYRSAGKDAKAIEIYSALLEVKKSLPAAESAPYHFELGSLHFKEGDLAKAQPEFEAALQSGFNPGATHFFLGMIAFRQKNWPVAESQLEGFRSDAVPDLQASAALYLAQAYSESGYGLGAAQAYYDARETSNGDKVLEAANKGLEPIAHSRFFSEVGLLVGYDSNPLTLPGGQSSSVTQQLGGGSSVNGAAQATGANSAEATLLASFGYMTSPLNSIQLVPSYRLRFNYGNAAAVSGNFAYNTLSLFVNHAPLSRLSYGLKLEGNLIFQDQVDDTSTGATAFHPYILNGGVGPYLRWQFGPYWALQAEAFLQPQDNFTDQQISGSPALFQSGVGYHLKVGVKKTGGSRFFNPGFYLSNDVNDTSGTQYRAETPDLGIDDDLKLTEKLNMIVGGDLAVPVYMTTSPGRVDKTASIYLSMTWLAWKRLTLLATASYASNVSNSDANNSVYSYNRGTFALGASWSIL